MDTSSLKSNEQESSNSSNTNTTGNKKSQDSSGIKLSGDDVKNLTHLKILALSVIVLSAVGIAITVYFYMTTTENDKFVTQFNYDAFKLLESIGTSTVKSLGILDEYATVACSYTKFGNRSFPNITIPDFAIRAAKYRSACGGIIFSHLPVVTPATRLAWEAYAWNYSTKWVNTTKFIQSNDENHYGGAIFDGKPERRSLYDTRGNDIPYNST